MVAVAGWLVFGLGSILVPLARHLDICPDNCLGTLVLVAGRRSSGDRLVELSTRTVASAQILEDAGGTARRSFLVR